MATTETLPTATGTSTSEFKLATAVAIFGGVLQAAAVTLETMKSTGYNPTWVSAMLVVIGGALQVATSLGYIKSRTVLKATAMKSEASVAVSAAVP